MSFLYLTLAFWCSLVVDPIPNFTKQNPLVIDHYPYHLRIELFTALNSFVGAVKLKNLCEFHFYSSYGKLNTLFVIVISPMQKYLLQNSLSTTKVSLV